MAARIRKGTKTVPMPEGWREKIQATQIVNRLMSCINGEIELAPTQITAANILLKKVAPDLAAIEHSGSIINSHEQNLADLENDGSAGT